MEKKYLLIGIFGFILGILLLLSLFSLSTDLSSIPVTQTIEGISYYSTVIVSTTGDFAGRTTPAHFGIDEIVPCKDDCSNNITNAGKNAIRDVLGAFNPSATPGNFTFIGLGNSSVVWTVSDANATLDNLYNLTSGAGLNISAGNYAVLTGSGNWTVSRTFTAATSNMKTNVTILTNSTESGILNYTMFAWRLFSDVTLQANDQLTVNWTVWIS